MSAKHVRTQGEIGVYSLKNEPTMKKFIPKGYFVRGHEGYIYALTMAQDDDPGDGNDPAFVLSLHQFVDAADPIGPLVSRRRVNATQEALIDLATERGQVVVTDSGDGTEVVSLSDDFEMTTDVMEAVANRRAEILLRSVYELAGIVGAGDQDGKQIALVSGDGRASKPKTAAATLDEVWIDDAWQPTIEEVAERAGLSPEATKKALQRGPYVSDKGRPAKWRRDPMASVSGRGTDREASDVE